MSAIAVAVLAIVEYCLNFSAGVLTGEWAHIAIGVLDVGITFAIALLTLPAEALEVDLEDASRRLLLMAYVTAVVNGACGILVSVNILRVYPTSARQRASMLKFDFWHPGEWVVLIVPLVITVAGVPALLFFCGDMDTDAFGPANLQGPTLRWAFALVGTSLAGACVRLSTFTAIVANEFVDMGVFPWYHEFFTGYVFCGVFIGYVVEPVLLMVWAGVLANAIRTGDAAAGTPATFLYSLYGSEVVLTTLVANKSTWLSDEAGGEEERGEEEG